MAALGERQKQSVTRVRRTIARVMVLGLAVFLAWCLAPALLLNVAKVMWLKSTLHGGQTGRLAQSEALLTLATKLQPDNRAIAFQRGVIAWERGDQAAALRYWSSKPDDARLGLYLHSVDPHQDKAMALYAAIIENKIGSGALYEASLLAKQGGRYDLALTGLAYLYTQPQLWRFPLRAQTVPEVAIEVDLGIVYYSLGDQTKALEHLLHADQLAQEKRTGIGLATNIIGIIYLKQQKPDLAEPYFKRLPRDFTANYFLGQIHLIRHNWPGALAAFRRCVAQVPTAATPHAGLAAAYEALGLSHLAHVERVEAKILLESARRRPSTSAD